MPWYEYTPRPGGTPLPMVQVIIWHGARFARLLAVVDSGADSSLLDYGYAELLGLDPSSAEKDTAVGASGNSFEIYRWPNAGLELQFENRRFPFLGDFAKFANNGEGMNLMGRKDFFREFMIQFWDAWEVMQIDLSPDQAQPVT
jgi:hypothetical protein